MLGDLVTLYCIGKSRLGDRHSTSVGRGVTRQVMKTYPHGSTTAQLWLSSRPTQPRFPLPYLFSSPSLFLSLQSVILFQTVSSPSSAFLHLLLPPNASFCVPCLQLALQLTTPTSPPTGSLQRSSPTQCNQLIPLWPPYIMEAASTLKFPINLSADRRRLIFSSKKH